jgi:hypothetical protein
MKHKIMTVLVLFLLVTACQGKTALVSTSSPTLFPMPTLTPSQEITPPLPTSIPTPIPTSAPIWQVVFYGISCPERMSRCDEGLFMGGYHSQWYLVNSDGSGLQPLTRTLPSLPQNVPMIRVSPDGSYLAYVDPMAPTDIVLVDNSGSNVARFEAVRSRQASTFDLLEDACIILYRYDITNPTNSVTVERICSGDTKPEELGTVEFPGQQRDYFRSYRLSPKGNRLLAYIQTVDGGDIRLYVQPLESGGTPHLLFSSPPKSCGSSWYQDIGPYTWSSDGKTVEMLWSSVCDGQAENIFYQIDPEEKLSKIRTTIRGISIDWGDWTPDNRAFAFWYYPIRGGSRDAPSGDKAGVYGLEFDTGEWKQIVSEQYVTAVHIWPTYAPEN